MTAFDQKSSKLILDQDLWNLGLISVGSPVVKQVKMPEGPTVCQDPEEELTVTLKQEVISLAGTNPKLTVQVKNLTSGSGECIEQSYTEIGFSPENLSIPAGPNDIMEYTFTFVNDEVAGDADIEAAILASLLCI